MKLPSRPLCAALLVFFILAGCSPYSFKSGRQPLVKSIGIPLFKNQTPEFGLAEQLTEGITNGLVAENIIDVTDPSRAEGLLKGDVLTYKRSAYTYQADESVQEYLVEITIKAELVRRDGGEPLWSEAALRGWGVYSADTEIELDGQTRAIAKLTEEIVDRTVKGW